jgi:hypothetical protein
MRRPARLAALALLTSLASAGVLPMASSQDRRERSRDEASAPDSAEPDAPEGVDDVEVDSTIRAEGGTKVKVMDFGDFDISGRLKSPQLLYFLNRLRAEFDRPRLPHRSFVGEMERSAHEKSF